MASVDKNQAVIEFLLQCPYIKDNPLFFNFINAKDNNKQVVTSGNDKVIDRPFIDGSVQKRYTFTIMDYKSVSYMAIAKIIGSGTVDYYPDENMEDILDTQQIIDWITEQENARNYPDFGEECVIDDMRALTDNPNLNTVDTSITPALAKYSISIQINYVDYTNLQWDNN